IDTTRRGLLAEVEGLKAQRNRLSKEIGALMAQKKIADAEVKKNETRMIGDKIKELDELITGPTIDLVRNEILLTLPNLPHSTVVIGKSASDNRVVRTFGEQKKFVFKPKTHVALCENLKLVDFERGAKLSGTGFVLYTNWGARLERALIQFMLDLHTREHGYVEVSPPYI